MEPALAVAAAASLALLSAALLWPVRRLRDSGPPRITGNPDMVDPVDAALTELRANLTGASDPRLAAHPATGKIHTRRRLRIPAVIKRGPARRDHTSDIPAAGPGTAAGSRPHTQADAVGRYDTSTTRPDPTPEQFAAHSEGSPVWYIRLAETTDDPHIAATAWAAAVAVAWRTSSPDLPDLAARARTQSDLVDYDRLASGMAEHMRITTTLPGGAHLTVARPDSWLHAAAALCACAAGDYDSASAALLDAPGDDPAIEVLRIATAAGAGRPYNLNSPHLTERTRTIAAAAAAAQ